MEIYSERQFNKDDQRMIILGEILAGIGEFIMLLYIVVSTRIGPEEADIVIGEAILSAWRWIKKLLRVSAKI